MTQFSSAGSPWTSCHLRLNFHIPGYWGTPLAMQGLQTRQGWVKTAKNADVQQVNLKISETIEKSSDFF